MGIKSSWVSELAYKVEKCIGNFCWLGEDLYQEHERSKDEVEMELGLDTEMSFLSL